MCTLVDPEDPNSFISNMGCGNDGVCVVEDDPEPSDSCDSFEDADRDNE